MTTISTGEALEHLQSKLGVDIIAPRGADRHPGALATARPTSTAHVQAVLRWAWTHRVPVVVIGGGTWSGTAGACAAGALVLCTEGLQGIDVDPVNCVVRVGAGTPTAELAATVSAHGVRLPVDVFGSAVTIGGEVATDARAAFALGLGSVADYIEGMRVVLADGTAVTVGPSRAHDADDHGLARLFTGSEGLLGVITEVTLRLIDGPALSGAVVASFASAEDAAAAAFDIAMTCHPAALDVFDAATASLLAEVVDLDLDGTVLSVFSVDAPTADLREICLDSGADLVRTVEPGELLDALELAHQRMLPVLRRAGAGLHRPVRVPETQLGAFFDCVGAIMAMHGVPLLTLAHAGEGLCHVIAVDDQAPESEPTTAAVQALADVQALAARLGEDASPSAGRQWMGRALGDAGHLTDRRMKIALDARGILNPGLLY